MVKAIIVGAAGRMGRQLIATAMQDNEIELVGGVVEPGVPEVGVDLGTLGGQQAIGILAVDDLKEIIAKGDVIIEFTAPEASTQHAELAARYYKPIVIGTTGLDTGQMARIRAAAEVVPVLLAPNMSVGVNVLLKVLPIIAKALGSGYDIEIVEAHHRMKRDAPSGTALKMAEAIASALNKDLTEIGTFGRRGIAPREEGEIGIHAVRAGGIVGDHSVIFANEGEQIEVVHRAFSRQTFALGALRAAKQVICWQPGLYSMQDVLGIA